MAAKKTTAKGTKATTSSKKEKKSTKKTAPRVKAKVKKTEKPSTTKAKKNTTPKTEVKTLPKPLQNIKKKENLGYQAFGVFLGILLTILVVLTAYNTYMVSKIEPEYDKISTIEEDVESIYKSTTWFPEIAPKLDIHKPSNNERWLGKEDNNYVWILYTDLSCEECAENYEEIIDLQKNNKDLVSIVLRHNPATKDSQVLAQKAECVQKNVGSEGFWNYINEQYVGLDDGQTSILEQVENLENCLENPEIKAKVEKDLDSAKKVHLALSPANVLYDIKTGNTKVVYGTIETKTAKELLTEFIQINS